jgi:hypothetical protein
VLAVGAIRASQLINRLHKCAFGEISLTMTDAGDLNPLKAIPAGSSRPVRNISGRVLIASGACEQCRRQLPGI